MTLSKIIKNKINSINNTKKITKTMEMVAVSKMKKAKLKMLSSKPYSDNIEKVIEHLSSSNLEYKHIYFHNRKIKNIGIILISTDRGLCGSLNSNLFKVVLLQMQKYLNQNIGIKIIIFGKKGFQFFKNLNYNILSNLHNIENQINSINFVKNIHILLKDFNINHIDKLYIAYNKYKSTLIQKPFCSQILPIKYDQNKKRKKIKWDYLYEPNSKILLDTLLNRFIESKIYQCVLNNLASEQASRMIAMKTASDNSSNFINKLELIYNKVRQSAITQELNEIIAGSHAITCD